MSAVLGLLLAFAQAGGLLAGASAFATGIPAAHRLLHGSRTPPALRLEVAATAQGWTYRYLSYQGRALDLERPVADGCQARGKVKPVELALPLDAAVELRVTSEEGIYIWQIDGIGSTDAIPGLLNQLDFIAPLSGTLPARCRDDVSRVDPAQVLRVLPEAEFESWLAAQAGARGQR